MNKFEFEVTRYTSKEGKILKINFLKNYYAVYVFNILVL